MRVLEAEGVRFEINPCKKKGCGKVCSDEEAIAHLRRWDDVLYPCAVCAKPIRPTLMEIDHVHKSNVDEEGWGVTYGRLEYEPHHDSNTNGPFGWFDIRVHDACARRAIPYADFERVVYPKSGEGPVPDLKYEECGICHEKPTLEDGKRVAALIYSFSGPCVYCNGPIKIEEIELFHGSMLGEHTGRWHFKNYIREASLSWWGNSVESGRLEFHGHISCALNAMPSIRWGELERAFEEVPQTAGKGKAALRRYLTKRIGKEVQTMYRLDWTHLCSLIQFELADLEGPREWVPGLVL